MSQPTPEPPPDRAGDENGGMTLARISWSVTAAIFLGVGIVLLAEGYLGYAVVTLVTGLAAAINLF